MDNSRKMNMTYQAQQRIEHLLTPDQAAALLQYVEIRILDSGCNHTHRYTQAWLDENIDFMKHEEVLCELENMGGYCDCEVVKNCFEDYKL